MSKEAILICLVFIMIKPACLAQVDASVPAHFNQFYNNYYLLSPANMDTSYQVKIMGGNKTQTGLFAGVNRIYFDSDLKVTEPEKAASSFIGIQAHNYREGDFINQSRLSARYSVNLRITDEARISAGASVGIVNYTFKPSQASPGGSSTVPDGSVGIWYLRKNFGIGTAGQQIFAGEIRPVNQRYQLRRNFNILGFKSFEINPYFNFNTHFFTSYTPSQQSIYSFAGVAELYEILQLGIQYRYKSNFNFLAGIKQLKIKSSSFGLAFSYQMNTSEISINDNSFELFISFSK